MWRNRINWWYYMRTLHVRTILVKYCRTLGLIRPSNVYSPDPIVILEDSPEALERATGEWHRIKTPSRWPGGPLRRL